MKYIVFASLASRIAFRHSEYTTRAAAIAKAELIFEHLSLQPKISAAVIPRSGI